MTFSLTVNQEKRIRQQRKQVNVTLPLCEALAKAVYELRVLQVTQDKTADRRVLVNRIDALLEKLGFPKL